MNLVLDALTGIFDRAEQRMPKIVQEPCPNPSCERGKVFVRVGSFYEEAQCGTCCGNGYVLAEVRDA